MIKFDHVSFSYGDQKEKQLDDLNLEISKGEFILVCGKSACGKTTVTKCINGLIPHFIEGKYEGSVTIDGKEVSKTPIYKIAEKAGSVFQNPKTQFFNLDTDSELVFGMENMGMDPNEIRKRVVQVTEDLQIKNLLGKGVFHLSGGEKQILALASVYAVNPDVYVLDEPSANIDQKGIDRLHEILFRLKEMGKTIIISEHRLSFLMDLIDRAVYIDHGRIQKIYTANEFKNMTEEERIALGLRCFRHTNRLKSKQDTLGEKIVSIQDLSVCWKQKKLLEHFSMETKEGDIIAVTGENGSGKSTFLRVLSGLKKEDAGKIFYDGKEYPYKKRRMLCYMTMQDVAHQLFGDSVWEEFSLLNKKTDEKEIEVLLKYLDLFEYKEKHPMILSGGQKQRLALAAAALSEKKILIFDEPTSGLDYENMCRVSELIKELSKERIIFVATHDQELKEILCNKEMKLSGTVDNKDYK